MTTKKDLLLKNVDHILLVNKDYEIVYNSRFDPAIGNKPDAKEYKNFFEMYPSLGRNNSSIVKTMSTGTRRGFIRPSSSFVTSNKSLNNRPRCWLEACAASRYCRARASIVAVCGFSASPKYPSIEATGVRIS